MLKLAAGLVLATCPAQAGQVARVVVADPTPDAAHPAAMRAMVLPVRDGAVNAVIYLAAGAGPHPTLLLLHGFPGNEQNLDLAQAARRDGWNVLTFHYRGSWGSPGAFSFAGAAQDAATVLAYLRSPEARQRFRVDTFRVAVAGHSMGATMAALVAADDAAVLGTFLIDPWDIAGSARDFAAHPDHRRAFVEDELRGDLPPLAGTGEAALMAEIESAPRTLDLAATVPALASRPLALVYARRGIGTDEARRVTEAARAAGARRLTAALLDTDHSFSDARIALADRLVRWLDGLVPAT
jgi:pimeloyl-ACP methyl ester carboxylesterase